MQIINLNQVQTRRGLFKSPGVTVARLVLASYLRSGWLWIEFLLVLAFLALLFFPYLENTLYFNGVATFSLGAIAVLGPAIMVRQATSARTYLVLARLSSRAAYSRGLMLAAAILRVPLYLFFLALVLLAHRLIDPTFTALAMGALGILPNTILIALLTVALSSPIATRLKRIIFLCWLVLALFSLRPIVPLPLWLERILSLAQLPFWPLAVCYNLSVSTSIDIIGLLGLLVIVIYGSVITLIAGRWLEKRELLLH